MYKYFALIIIFFANFLDYLDRTIISALLSNIQRDFDITESQKGMLISAFIVGYIIAAPFIGILADKKNRPRLFAICALIWSTASIGSGLSQDFVHMLLSRMFLGFGEAGAIVIGPSLIADYFPANVRGRVIAVFFLGMPIGGTAGYLLAGELVNDKAKLQYDDHTKLGITVTQHVTMHTKTEEVVISSIATGSIAEKKGIKPGDVVLAVGKTNIQKTSEYNTEIAREKEVIILLIEVHHGWRRALFIAGIPGVLLAFLLFFLRDPPRTVHDGGHSVSLKDMSHYKELLHKKALFLIILAQTASAFVIAPIAHFGVEYLEEEKHMQKAVATRTFGIAGVLGGIIGNFAGGWLGDRLATKNKGAYIMIAGSCFLIALPFIWVGLALDAGLLFIPSIFLGFMFLFGTMTTINTQITNIVSPSERSRAFAITLFMMHLFGDLCSPPLFGVIADNIGRRTTFMITPLLLTISGICCLAATRHAREAAEKVSEQTEGGGKQH